MKLPFLRAVRQNTARNPVARAVARNSLLVAMRAFLISIYMIEDGSQQGEAVDASAAALAVALRLLEQGGEVGTPDARVMQGAMSALVECSKRGCIWRSRDARAIDEGLQRAFAVVSKAKPDELQRAWAFLRQVETAWG